MTFTVTYRGPDGSVITEAEEAASRTACFALMRTKGIVPISVTEGWRGRGATSNSRKSKRPLHVKDSSESKSKRISRTVLLAACLAIAIVGGGVWWWVHGLETQRPARQKSLKSTSHPAVVKTQSKPDATKPAAMAKPSKAATDGALKAELTPERIAIGRAVPTLAAQGETIDDIGLAGTNDMDMAAAPKREKLFKHGAEQLLALATPASPGMSVPPLPAITDESVAEDLQRALRSTITAAPGDTERDLEVKMTVAQQKEEFRELRQSGMTFTEYVNALRSKFNDDAQFLSEARQMDESLFHDGEVSDADYKTYRDELNRHLRDRGLPELDPRNMPESQPEAHKEPTK